MSKARKRQRKDLIENHNAGWHDLKPHKKCPRCGPAKLVPANTLDIDHRDWWPPDISEDLDGGW